MFLSPRTPRHRPLGAIAALVALMAATTLAACDPTPDQDAFYTPPAITGQPGDVLRSRPSTFTLDPINQTPEAGVTANQVIYHSTDATGRAMAVSGTVLVPTSPWIGFGKRPLITFGVGTRGLGDGCAPSYTLTQGTDYEGLFIKPLLDLGWAVAISDYQGLGTPGTHTYMVGPAQGHAVLDIARAAQRLPGTGLSSTSPVGIIGYSQGGGAAGWAAQMAGSYAPDLKVKGTAAGGVPGDLTAVANGLDGGPTLIFALMASIGLDAAYPELNLDSYLNDKGRQLLAESQDTCVASIGGVEAIFKTAFTSRSDYTTTDPLAAPAWKARLAQSKLGSVKPNAPVYQYQGVVDTVIPYEQAATLRRSWCNKGANVTFVPLPGEHITSLLEGYAGATTWMATRLAGIPTFGTCFLP